MKQAAEAGVEPAGAAQAQAPLPDNASSASKPATSRNKLPS